MALDTMPLYDLIDGFRTDCITAKVINGCVDQAMMLQFQAGQRPPRPKPIKPAIEFDACHALDFGYLFNVGADRPDVFTEEEVFAIKETAVSYGLSLAYPKMLLVERTIWTESRLFVTYVYETNGHIAFEYYVKDSDLKSWAKVGHLEDIIIEPDTGVMSYVNKGWGLMTPPGTMPVEDDNPINHFARMTITLIAMLMRRGDDVEQVFIERDRTRKGSQRQTVRSASIIRLHKRVLINNLVDEDKAVVVSRTVGPHDRGGTIAHRIKDETCEHLWVEEFRDETRWRNRCRKCDSCEFWRVGAKVKGGAGSLTLHTVTR